MVTDEHVLATLGLTQANRLGLRPPSTLDLDCFHVSNWWLRNDWRLLARTIPIALRGSGRHA
jgi:hypothetical protein